MELALAVLHKVMGVRVGKQDVHVQFKASIRGARLQRRRVRRRVERDQHLRRTVDWKKIQHSVWMLQVMRIKYSYRDTTLGSQSPPQYLARTGSLVELPS